MARYARWERPVQDESGNLINGVWCRVRSEILAGSPLATLYSDRAGTVSLSNPFFTESGPVKFHCLGGAYMIDIWTASGWSEQYRYQGVGIGSETDITGLTPMGLWSNATTYEIGDMVVKVNSGTLHLFASRTDSNLNNTPDATTPGDTTQWMYLGVAAGATTGDVLTALGITGITISENEPSGGSDGNLWLQI